MTECDPPPWAPASPSALDGPASQHDADVRAAIAGAGLTWGAGAMRPDGLAVVCNDIIVNGRRRIVELGSGVSTVVLARLLNRRRPRGDWRLVAVEHDTAWVQRVTDELDRAGIADHVTVVHAPLVPHRFAAGDLRWYDEAAVAAGLDAALAGNRIDLLVVDGPPAYVPGFGLARYPALPVLRRHLAPGATIVLDDVERPGEQEVMRRWERETGLSFERVPEPAGVAIATTNVRMATQQQR